MIWATLSFFIQYINWLLPKHFNFRFFENAISILTLNDHKATNSKLS